MAAVNDRVLAGTAVADGTPALAVNQNALQDRVRWGPIWAGLVTAIATFLVLSAAAVAVGAQAVESGVDPDAAGLGGGIASGVIALIAFFAGGFVAGRSAAAMRRGYGALNGFLVWALGVVVILALAAFGLGSLFGASGDLFAQYRALGTPTPEGIDPQAAAEGIRNSSIGALVAMVLPAVAAALGGWAGTRETTETAVVVDRTANVKSRNVPSA